jgi:hypothetical protein
MFEKGCSRSIASENVFISKQISVMNEEVNVPALFKSVQKLAGKPSHSHGYQLLARIVLEQWHSLVGTTMATRRYHPSNNYYCRRKAAFRACSQANGARSPQPISGRGTCAWQSAIHRRHSTELRILVFLQYLHSSIYQASFSDVHH